MGLPYPAGPEIDRLAERGNPKAFDFPRPMIDDPNDDFSFSGLKTSVRYFLRDHPGLLDDPQRLRDLCASVQAAIVEVLVAKTIRAARRLRVGLCHGFRRRHLQSRPAPATGRRLRSASGLPCWLAEKSLCTDNAAMIGILAERKLAHRAEPTAIAVDILPNWALG